MKRKVIIWGLTAIAAVSLISLKAVSINNQKYINVKAASVTRGDIKAYLSTTGIVKSKNIKEYYGLQGTVQNVNVRVGDMVKKGDIMITYNVPYLSSSVKQAELQYENAKLQRTDAVNQNEFINSRISDINNEINSLEISKNPADIAKIQTLRQQKSSLQPLSKEKLSQLDNAVELARISLAAAKEKQTQSKDRIVSDINGTVTSVNASEGAVSSNMQPVIVVQDTESLKVEISIGKYDVNKISLNEEAAIKSSGKKYKGKVSFINPSAQRTMSQTGGDTSLGVDVDILEKAEGLKIGFDTDIDILLGQATNIIKIPAESVKTDKSGSSFVYVIDQNKADKRDVKLGLQSDLEVQVIEGLTLGEKVILNPSSAIKTGSLVKQESGR